MKFIKRLFLFLLPLMILLTIFEILVRTKNGFYKQKITGLEQKAADIQILILGSSHTALACNPKYFSLPTYNMAFGYQNFYFDEKILEKVLPILPKLTYVILDVSYHNFNNDSSSFRDYFYQYYYNILPSKRTSRINDVSHFLFLYDQETRWKVLIASDPILQNGFEAREGNNITQLNDSFGKEKMAAWNIQSSYGEYFKSNCALLERMIVICKKRGVTPVLVAPVMPGYVNKYADSLIQNRNSKVIRALVNKYNVPFFDLHDSRRFNDKDFLDGDHVNFQGSIKFTQILDSSIMHLKKN